jgi:hypothetical protein
VWLRLGAGYLAAVAGLLGILRLDWLLLPWLDHVYEAPGATWLRDLAVRLVGWTLQDVSEQYPTALASGTVLLGAGILLRMLARARVRDGRDDLLEPVRRWLARHPGLARVPAWIPGALLVAWVGRDLWRFYPEWYGYHTPWTLLVSAAAVASGLGFAMGRLVRVGQRALLAPIEIEAAPAMGAEEIWFSAVAVTPRTRAAVAGAAAMALAAVIAALTLPPQAINDDPRVLGGVTVYVVAMLAAIQMFRRASRIAVGLDGVYVQHGSSTQFHAYRDLHDVRAHGAELELLRGKRVTLRLQLHGSDETRRDELQARIQGAIVRAREGHTRGAEQIVQASSRARIASAADGGVDYRSPSVTREQLWSVVEGASADTTTRAAAAEALAVSVTNSERARLLAAASRSVDPKLRVTLDALASDEEVPDVEAGASRRAANVLR